jgi:hypothetical protein
MRGLRYFRNAAGFFEPVLTFGNWVTLGGKSVSWSICYIEYSLVFLLWYMLGCSAVIWRHVYFVPFNNQFVPTPNYHSV